MEASSPLHRDSLVLIRELSAIQKMLKLVFIFVLVTCCLGAPAEQQSDYHEVPPRPLLTRPAPINPEVLGEPRPEEKITPIKNDVEQTSNGASTRNAVPGPISLQYYDPQKAINPPVVVHAKRDIPVPLSLPEKYDKSTSVEPLNPQVHHQIAIKLPITADVKEIKRDIPVPASLPNKQSEAPEHEKEASTTATEKNVESEQKTHHPATFVHPVPVSQLFGNKKTGVDPSS